MNRSILTAVRIEIRAYLSLHNYKEGTFDEYRISLNNIEAFFEKMQMSHYNYRTMEMFREHVQNRRDAGTLGLTFYRSFLRTSHYVDNFYNGDLLTRLPEPVEHDEELIEEETNEQSQYIELVYEFLETVGYGPIRQENAIHTLNRYLLFLSDEGWTPLYVITLDKVARYVMLHGSNPDKLRKEMVYIRAFMLFLSERGMAEEIPAKFTYFKNNRTKRVLPCFTHSEIENLLISIDRTTPKGSRAFAIIIVAMFTGLRSSDICNLSISDLDFVNHSVKIRQQKTKVFHELPLLPLAEEALVDYMTRFRPDSKLDTVFLTDSGKPFRTMNTVLHDVLKASNLKPGMYEGHTFHAFRRCLALWLIESGATPDMISMILGHTDPNCFRRYIPLSNNLLSICGLSLSAIPCRLEVLA